jgi:general secretion pathway protein G
MKITASPKLRSQAGFTLMELMLVLGIITLLLAAGMKMAPIITKSGKETTARADIGNLSASILMYQNKHSGRLPSDLNKMVSDGSITENLLMDPWGQKYMYTVPAKRSKTDKYDLYSIGQDGQDGNGDDVGNFETN